MRTLGGRSHDATAGVPVSDPWIPGIPDPNIPNNEQNGSTPRGSFRLPMTKPSALGSSFVKNMVG
jgi:hypothetical protein